MGLFGFYFDRVWEVFKISRFGKMCYVWVPWQHFLPFFCSEGDSTSICSETSGRYLRSYCWTSIPIYPSRQIKSSSRKFGADDKNS